MNVPLESEHHTFWENITLKYPEVLDPLARISEVIFGLIMVLTFTCSISVATADRSEIGIMLWAALGCNTAWGIVDAFMVLMATLVTRGQGIRTLKQLRSAKTEEEGNRLVKENLPPILGEVMPPEYLGSIRMALINLPEPPARSFFTRHDFRNAVIVFFLVFLSTFPVVIPFLVIKNPVFALRVSNGVALALLFWSGVYMGRQTGYKPLRMGIVFALTGAALVSLTMYLGG